MGLSFAAMLPGANEMRSIWRWGRRLTPKGLAMLGIDRGRAPCHATYHYVFRAIPAADLERALGAAVQLDGPLGHVAIDGKRLRGSQHETSPGVHMLQAISIRLQASIGSPVVPPDSGEVVEALKLLKDLPLEGAVLTGDAAFTTEKIARAIRDGGGHYFLFVKGNQPDQQAEIARSFGDDSPLKARTPAPGPEQGSPRPARPQARIACGPWPWPDRNPPYRCAHRSGSSRYHLERHHTRRSDRVPARNEDPLHAAGDLRHHIDPPGMTDEAGLLALARDHWQIENRLFRVRDGTFAEDACRVRTRSAPQNLAHIRDAALTLIRRRKLSPKPAREAFANNPKARYPCRHPIIN
jgi:predicted transposase YbfD/YdcC